MTKNNISITDRGKGGTPFVLLHSLAGNSTQWAAQIAFLEKTRRVIALDLPGHGESAALDKDEYTLQELAALIQQTIDALGIETYYLAGHSMGAALAAVLAAGKPEKTAGLLLLDPAGDSTGMPQEQVRQYMEIMQSEGYHEFMDGYWNQLLTGSTAKTRQLVLDDLHHTDKKTVINYFKPLFVFNPLPYLKKYSGPKMIVFADGNDTPISVQNIARDIPAKKISGTGHWLQIDNPEAVNHIFEEFLGD